MKYFFTILLFALCSVNSFSQVWTNNGAVSNVLPGAVVNRGTFENLSGTTTNNGTFILTAGFNNGGTVNGSGNYYVGGNWTNSGVFTPGAGTVTFNGTGAQTVTSTTFNNLTIDKVSGTATLSGNVFVNGDFAINSGTLNLNAFTLAVTGNATFTAGTINNGIITSSGANTTFSGTTFGAIVTTTSNALYLNGSTFNNTVTLTKNGATNNTGTGGNIFNSTFTITNSGAGFLRLAGTTADDYNGDATFNQTGSGLLQPAYASNCTFAGNISTAGTTSISFGDGTGTVTLDGTGAQLLDGSLTSQTYNNIVVAKTPGTLLTTGGSVTTLTTNNFTETTGDFTAPATMNVNGNLIMSAGSFLNNGLLYVKGTITNDQSSMTAGTGTLNLIGTGAQTINGSQTFKTFNLVSNNTAGITLNNNLSVSGAHTYSAGNITTSATPNYLVYEAGSSYSGDADSRHVNGWVKKFGGTNFIFPVGTATYERTASVTNLSAVSEVNCRYYRTTQNRFNLFSPLVFVDSAEYWQIDRISGGTFKIALNWDNSKVPFNNVLLADVHGAYYTGGLWTNIAGTPAGTPATTGTLTLTNNVGVGLNPFTFGFTSWSLPLKIVSFSAQRRSDISFLTWATENEFNVDHFEIERSDDGIHFYTIGTMAARNLSRQETYTYSDRASIQRMAWYRLVSVDNDGRKSYSNLVAVSVARTDADLKLLVNPVISQILLEAGNNLTGLFEYRLCLPNGQQVQAGKLEIRQAGLQIIPISAHINPGTYILEVYNAEKRFNYKVVLK